MKEILIAGLFLIMVAAMINPLSNLTTGQERGGTSSNILDSQQPLDANTADGSIYNRNQRFGACFQALHSPPIILTVSFAKGSQTPNGTLTGELWPTTGNPGSNTCIAGVGAILASSNTINANTVTLTSYSVFAFTFTATTLIIGNFYLVDIFYTGCPPSSCNMIILGFTSGGDSAHDSVNSGCSPTGWGGSCGQSEFTCLGIDGCPSYTLTTNPYGTGNANITVSPGIQTLALLPLTVAVLGLGAAWIIARPEDVGKAI